MSNMEGKKVPQVTFRTRQGDQWVDVTTSELFDNKTVVVFSLPGAFTPTCSSSHLPRYNELAPVFKKHGVDDILVVSVNDTFRYECLERSRRSTQCKIHSRWQRYLY